MYVCIYIEPPAIPQFASWKPQPIKSSMIDPIFHKRFFHSYVKSRAFFHVTLHLCFYVYSCKKTMLETCDALPRACSRWRRQAPENKTPALEFSPLVRAKQPSGIVQPFRGVLPPCIYVIGNASARVCHRMIYALALALLLSRGGLVCVCFC